MTRTSRALGLVCTGALAVAVASPGLASADDAAPTFSRAGVSDLDPSSLYAGYSATLGTKKSISGTLTIPTLGSCAQDGGLLLAIELLQREWVRLRRRRGLLQLRGRHQDPHDRRGVRRRGPGRHRRG